MGLPEELYFAMLELGYCARRSKIPGPLAPTMIDSAQKCLDLWREDKGLMQSFAVRILSGPTNLRETTGQLPEDCARACWRIITLLEYAAVQSRATP
jgi:hypothetical protein